MITTRFGIFTLALITMIAFASNSILCRMALLNFQAGALTFTVIRMTSGAFMLLPILLWPRKTSEATTDRRFALTWPTVGMAASLFSYALFFSLAYLELQAATGAIILFPTVQITMIGLSLLLGNRLSLLEWVGFAVALTGLVYLVLPGLAAPPLLGASMMMLSGISWGVYSILGQREPQPVVGTARNFLFGLPLAALLLILLLSGLSHEATPGREGILLGITSGAIASGLGYILWYLTLRRITTTLASLAQLSVPIIAAFGGVVFLDEHLSLRLIIASGIILSGIALAILGRRPVNR